MSLTHLLLDPTVPEVLCAAALPAWALAVTVGRPLVEGRRPVAETTARPEPTTEPR